MKSPALGKHRKPPKIQIGWQEWCALPKLHLPAIKTKIDTGAKTSALHAWDIHLYHKQGVRYVHFIVHPLQNDLRLTRKCSAPVVDERTIMNSAGHKELRYVIRTPIVLGDCSWEIEISLTNRDSMTFRMLLGRDALKGMTLINPGKKLCQGKLKRREARALYKTHKAMYTL